MILKIRLCVKIFSCLFHNKFIVKLIIQKSELVLKGEVNKVNSKK